ncbi:MAG TPA: D-alanyl-lipoteichoic acid biosynthesis protein DltD [Candidatus Udaeobacter sp.]|nr:D-alanyl-lipoteichoic acid biosynthesis protein DltD [Candidatus Udaeobacter sp.]
MGSARIGTPHLLSGLIAGALAGVILATGLMAAIRIERHALTWTAPQVFQLKNQGLAFQRAAARESNVLPLYGSSELILGPISQRGGYFFRNAPTGFELSPVGKPGATTATILQKIAALGSDLRGKKVAISLSPAWFLMPGERMDWYEGNFSPLIANELAFGTALDFELKRQIASRMLQFPDTLEKTPLLEFALRRLSSEHWIDRLIFCAVWPVGRLYTAALELQDHFAAVKHILYATRTAPARQRPIPERPKLSTTTAGAKVVSQAESEKTPALVTPVAAGSYDKAFVTRLNKAPAWADLELLLRTLAKIGAKPLLISMPMDGQFYDQEGVSRLAREAYYKRLRVIAQPYHFALIEFEKYDEDPDFLDKQHTHLTGKGWMSYDRALDDFFHGRVARN